MRGGDDGDRLAGLESGAQSLILVGAPGRAMPVRHAGGMVSRDAVLPGGPPFRGPLPSLRRGPRRERLLQALALAMGQQRQTSVGPLQTRIAPDAQSLSLAGKLGEELRGRIPLPKALGGVGEAKHSLRPRHRDIGDAALLLEVVVVGV